MILQIQETFLTNKHKYNTRLAGCALILLASANLFIDGFADASIPNKLFTAVWIIIGLIYIINPVWATKPFRKFKKEFITIDKDKIAWSLGDSSQKTQIRFEDISSWTNHVGEVHFKTKSGKNHILKTHKIYDDQKHKEFYKLLNEDFQKRIG